MSYTVLARKWRPQNFQQLVGQEHVQRAIVNAIEQERLHHAYLFTGTRGVGKTTIARIFSKCLNCEQGITATPCGTCATCVEIDQGRFVDLLEIDAASRTKVEDTREILDNVQYRPSRGRYKVYLIDEVHMLSNSSFNALLKTLEEPPPHVIFLLATTDPQKLPVTVLSRCLQFHLKRMSQEHIESHLSHILEQESIAVEEGCLPIIAKAADGSMRDALSILDQAIAFGAGALNCGDVSAMLGTIDHRFVLDILTAMAQQDGAAVLAVVERMAEYSPDYQQVLADIISTLHQMAVHQLVGSEVPEAILQLCEVMSPNDIQLFYQIATHARKDLPLAPEPREGFEMALLRMMAFRPQHEATGQPPAAKKKSNGLIGAGNGSETYAADSRSLPATTAQSSTPTHSELNDAQHSEQMLSTPAAVESEKVEQSSVTASAGQSASAVESAQTPTAEPAAELARADTADSTESVTAQKEPDSSSSETEQMPSAKPSDDLSSAAHSATEHSAINAKAATNKPIAENAIKPASVERDWQLEAIAEPVNWHAFIQQLPLTGALFQILNNSTVASIDGTRVCLTTRASVQHFMTDSARDKITADISTAVRQSVSVEFDYVDELANTPKDISEQNHLDYLNQVKDEFLANQNVQSILSTFDAQITTDNIELKQ
ncbi:MAG: DNA polymerase III subunit gamma/tau [Gammaproteobacteria bacterium]|nr:DNA polymerase III subunit gamma/tau [Gammaproteobacteria bacterium]